MTDEIFLKKVEKLAEYDEKKEKYKKFDFPRHVNRDEGNEFDD